MATDRKADYVGNHGGAYTDIDGMSKQFTYVDHDKKTTISLNSGKSESVETGYREQLVTRVLDQPASICPEIFSDFTIRGEGKSHIEWDKNMLTNKGLPILRLQEMVTLLENKAEAIGLTPQVRKTY